MKKKIAIFEDIEINRFIYESLLKTNADQSEVYLFGDPQKGYAKAAEVPFDIVFIEIHFWGQNFSGITILKKLREIMKHDFTAIALTSLLQDGDHELILNSGFTMCLEKPLSFEMVEQLMVQSFNGNSTIL